MQEIRAYIKPFMLEKVALRLISMPDFPGMSVINIKGFGKERVSRAQEYDPFVEKVRIEIIAPDTMVQSIVNAIMEEAHSGKAGDGKIYVTPIGKGYRIRDGQEE